MRLSHRPSMPPRSRGPYRRLARQLREAHLRALPSEARQLQVIEAAVLQDSVSALDAQEILRGVIRSQLERGALKGKKAA